MSGLVRLLNSVIGSKGIKLKKTNEYIWFCPFHPHHKPKLQINLKSQYWHCWVCDSKGRKFYQLFRKVGATQEQLNELNEVTNYIPTYTKSDKTNILKLPDECEPLWNGGKGPNYDNAKSYLLRRGITDEDLMKYNIGYCNSGLYGNRIIIPSYDSTGKLNFFVGRDFYKSKMKYRNCSFSKDVIGFDLFINWDEPIVLCEGPFDAIAIKRNVIPLFGKTISHALKKKIVEKKVKKIYIILDQDAIRDSIKLIEQFMKSDIKVYFVNLTGKDPSDLGFEKITKMIRETTETTFSDLIQLKLSTKSIKQQLFMSMF